MNATQLLTHFERLAEAPDAVPRLRRFILDLAVRGKLVEQDSADESAPELLTRIQAEKVRLVKSGAVKASKPIADADDVDASLIPNTWRWSSLAEVGFISPRNAAPDDQLASFVPMPCIAADYGTPNRHEVRSWREIKTGYTHFAEGDVGLAKITPCFENGKSTVFRGLVGGIGAGTTELHIVRPVLLSADYILIYLKSSVYIATGIPRMTGTAGQKRVPSEYFTQSPFPLPPLAEQHRIVAKVDELMALCDQLEAAQQERERRRDRLAAASLQRLNQPADANPATDQTEPTEARQQAQREQQKDHARFHLQNLNRLTTRPEHVKATRQTIRNLAMTGRLATQSRSDEPASTLLELNVRWRIAAIKRKQIRDPRKELAEVDHEFTPYDLPVGWAWARLGEVIYIQSGDGLTAANMKEGSIPVFGGNGINGHHDAFNVEAPTLVVGRVGYYCGSIHITPERAWVTDNAFVTHFCPELFSLRFLALLLMSTNLKENEGATAQPVISGSKIYPIVVGVPPLAEQHRIIAKVDELMALCDQLEAQLTQSQTDSRRLLEAVLEAALTPA